MKHAYLVLSVNEIEAMLAAVKLEQKSRNNYKGSVTLVLQDIQVDDDDGQIASWSVMEAVQNANREALELLRDAQQTACFNDSNAAI